MNLSDLESGAIQYRSAIVEDVTPRDGILTLRAVPYDAPTDIGGGITETFVRGAFARAVSSPHRVRLKYDHDGALVGRAIDIEDRADGPWIRAKVSDTQPARDMLTLIDDGVLSQVSVEFRPMRDYMRVVRTGARYAVTHTRAHMTGIAVVPDGAYGDAAFIESVRDADRERAQEEAQIWLTEYRRRFTA